MMKFWADWWNQAIGPKHWRFLLIVNAVFLAGYLVYHISREPYSIVYTHLLVDYHFGVMKRALIGAILALFVDRVPVGFVFGIGSVALLITFALYFRLFQKTFGFSNATAPLAVFVFGSPFFFKHFIKSIGFFDIYGCMLAVAVLLVPANSLGIIFLAGIGSVVLIFIHHLHMLLFIPVIGAIVIIRFYLARETSRAEKLIGIAFALAVFATFIWMQFFGAVQATPEEFRAYVESRMVSGADMRAADRSEIWFRTYADEIRDTLAMMRTNFWFIWAYIFLFVLHIPLIRYIRNCVLGIAKADQRKIVIALLVLMTLGYGVILATVYDYGRWVSSWVVCMILMLHAIRTLEGVKEVPLIAADDRTTFRLACGVTAVPKVGIIRPFD